MGIEVTSCCSVIPITSRRCTTCSKVKPDEFQSSIDHLRQHGVEVFNIENRDTGVFWGPQAYFLDPDGKKLEIYAGPGAKVG